VVRWQESQERMVTKWLAGFPVAFVPLWQVAQLPGATPVCAKFAGAQAVVRWHESHERSVARCRAGRADALVPL
jgi:hypothetical protein